MTKIIISDTSCLIALSNIGYLEILNKLYQKVYITNHVAIEYGELLPDWVEVQKISNISKFEEIRSTLDIGEASSIVLALENPGSILIIDEKKGRQMARSFQIEIMGTLKILLTAKTKGVIPSLNEALQLLTKNNFRIEKMIAQKLLKEANEL